MPSSSDSSETTLDARSRTRSACRVTPVFVKTRLSCDRAVCVVMHDLTTAARFADDVVILGADGRVSASGDAAATLSPETLELVFGAPFERIDAAGGPAILPRPLASSSETGR